MDLLLRMKCDDGLAANIMDDEGSHYAPEMRDSTATGSSDDGSNATFGSSNINNHRDKFRVGKNLLAIHGMNVSTGSTDFLQVAELQTNEHDYQAAIWI